VSVSHETCVFCSAFDPMTLEPLGPCCGQVATQIIHWLDGRSSTACGAHGLDALDGDAKALVFHVAPLRGAS
jgi:hypothetical protein